jgi:toxin FitB
MNLIDSSGWLEYFVDGGNSELFAPVIEDIGSVIISTINIFEVFKKIRLEKDEQSAVASVNLMSNAVIVPVDYEIAVEAARLSLAHKLPMADSVIYATALRYNAIVYTQDSHFEGLHFVKYFKKR